MLDIAKLAQETFIHRDEVEPDEFCGKWEIRNLSHAYQEREPWKYLVDGLIPYPSLIAVYGGPGSLKSMLMADLCAAVAGGGAWLPPTEGKLSSPGATFQTENQPILWIDFDNGTRRTDERMDAVASARRLPVDAPFHYVSMPRPWLDISKPAMVDSLAATIKSLGAKLIVIDNLGLVTGDTEENSAEMAQVMGNLRHLCEISECCIVVIHHQRKSGGAGDKGIRKGETLRGHSSIEAALDLALLVERTPGEDTVTCMLTKVRGFSQYLVFGALFTYEHVDGTHDLDSARFFCNVADSTAELEKMAIESEVLRHVQEFPGLNQAKLIEKVVAHMALHSNFDPKTKLVRGIINDLVKDGDLRVDDGPRNSNLYYIV